MNVLSLFDGISCGQQALKILNLPVSNYYASEIDTSAMIVAAKNHPTTKFIGDVRDVTGEDLPKIDLLIGGSPCQSFSKVITNNSGLEGKSGLFFEYIRLLKLLKPTYFLLENVDMKQEWLDFISNELEVQPFKIDSGDYSAQNRLRWYWTNLDKPKSTSNSLVLNDILEEVVPEKYFYTQTLDFHGLDKRICATVNLQGHDFIKRVQNPSYKCQTLTAVCGGNQHKKVYINGRCRKLTPKEYERLQTLPDDYTLGISDSARYKTLGNGWTVAVIADILKSIGECK